MNIGGWAVLGAAFCCYVFYLGFLPQGLDAYIPSWMTGTVSSVLTPIAILLAFYWLVTPLVLLIIGLGLMAAIPGPHFRWSATWTLLVLAGFGPDAIAWWSLNPFNSTFEHLLAFPGCAVGYLAIGVAMTRTLIASSRPALTPPGAAAAAGS